MNSKLTWDDLKIVAAIGAEGTLSGAARRLATSHATVYRRLGRIEEEIGARLFDRARDGYRPTLAGEKVLTLAGRVEAEILAVERSLAGRDLKPAGTVRLTTTDSLFTGLIAPVLASFQRAYPEILVEVTVSNRAYDLSKREADVAIRPANAPPETLIGRRVGRIRQAAYRRPGERAADSRDLDWIGVDGAMPYREMEDWMRKNGLTDRCIQASDSVLAMQASARAGVGAVVLPMYLGEEDAGLERLGAPIDALETDLWILTHADLRNTARIKALTQHVGVGLSRGLERYAGIR